MNITTEEGDLITAEMCGHTYVVIVRSDGAASSFALTLSEMADFIAAMQKALIYKIEDMAK